MDGIKLGDEEYTWDDIEDMETEDVESLRDDVESAINEVGSQLNEAKAQARIGAYSDPEWFQRAKSAKARLSTGLQRLGRILKKRKREVGRDFCEYFMDTAREQLDAQQFENIFETAKARMDE